MNKVLIAGTILSVVTLAGCSAEANPPSTHNLNNLEYSYKIFERGIYEFTPKSNKNKTCVALKSYRAVALQYFDKPTENTKK